MTPCLSEPQRELLSILRRCGAVRTRQAAALLKRRFGVTDTAAASLISQLRRCGLLREESGLVRRPDARQSLPMLRAVDVLLAAVPAEAPELLPRAEPFLLAGYFLRRGLLVQVLHVPAGEEQRASVLTDSLPAPGVPALLVLLLDNAGQCPALCVRRPCMAAWPDRNEKLCMHKYGGAEHE